MDYQEFCKNLTITFSGFNIKNYLRLAIESLLAVHPELKDNIVVFDDNSTDGTSTMLKEMSIKRISWLPEFYSDVENYQKNFGSCMAHYTNLIIYNIMKQINTKYALINDGDVVFLSPFLYDYINLIQDRKALIVCETLTNFENFKKKSAEVPGVTEDYINKYSLLVRPCGTLYRAHLWHGLLDLSFLKDSGIYFDDIFDEQYTKLIAPVPIADGGLNFFYSIESNKIKYLDLNEHYGYQQLPVYHFGWRSSLAKYLTNTRYTLQPVEQELEARLKKDMDGNKALCSILDRFKHIAVR